MSSTFREELFRFWMDVQTNIQKSKELSYLFSVVKRYVFRNLKWFVTWASLFINCSYLVFKNLLINEKHKELICFYVASELWSKVFMMIFFFNYNSSSLITIHWIKRDIYKINVKEFLKLISRWPFQELLILLLNRTNTIIKLALKSQL